MGEDTTHFEKKQGGLEKSIELLIGTIFLLFGFYFLSFKITGYTIFNLTVTNSNIFGIILIVLGLISYYFYLKNK